MHGSIWWLILSAAIFVIGFGGIGLAFARVDRPGDSSVVKGMFWIARKRLNN